MAVKGFLGGNQTAQLIGADRIRTGNGNLIAPVTNYLSNWSDASQANNVDTLVSPTSDFPGGGGVRFYADITNGSNAIRPSTSTALRGSFNWLTAFTASSTAGTRFVGFPIFTLESADVGKPLVVSFDITSTIADGDWDVVVVRYNSAGTYQETLAVAGNASSATATPSAKLPTGTAKFTGFFVPSSTATDQYVLRFRRLVGSQQIRIDSVFVGPQTILTGAPVTDWQTYTPLSNVASNVTLTGRYKQVGDTFQFQLFFAFTGVPTGALTITPAQLFNGLGRTLDTTKLVNSGTSVPVGNWYALDTAVQDYSGEIVYNGATFFFTRDVATASLTSPFAIGNTDTYCANISVPATNSSSNNTSAERAVEEFAAYTTGATSFSIGTTQSTVASVVFGAQGQLIPNITTADTTAGSTDFIVVWQTSVQPTDVFVLELQQNGTGPWFPAEQRFPNISQGNGNYGMQIFMSGGNLFVGFGRAGAIGNNATYGGTSSVTWASLNGGGTRYRVRKVSGGAVVGFPIDDVNVIGDYTFFESIASNVTLTRLPTLKLVSTASARSLTLPNPTDCPIGNSIQVKDDTGQAGANNITVNADASNTIDGAATNVISTNWASRIYIRTSATTWRVI